MINKIKRFFLKRDIDSYQECEYIKPVWKIVLIDGREYDVTTKYSYCKLDSILKDKFIINDSYFKINETMIVPVQQIKEIILISCDKFTVHTYDWMYSHNLYWYNTLKELKAQDEFYQNKLSKLNLLTT